MQYKIFTTKTCSTCAELKKMFNERHIPFEESNLEDPESIVYLRSNSVFTLEAPIIEDNDNNKFYNFKEIRSLLN